MTPAGVPSPRRLGGRLAIGIGLAAVLLAAGTGAPRGDRYRVDARAFFQRIDLGLPGLARARDLVAAGREDAAGVEYLRWRDTAARAPKFFFSAHEPGLGATLQARFPEEVRDAVDAARRILANEIPFEGYTYRLSDPPNYFPRSMPRAVRWVIGRLGGAPNPRPLEDILVNSFGFITENLGVAYLVTRDERFADKFCYFFRTWSEAASPLRDPYVEGDVTHPQAYGLFTVAARASAWLFAERFFAGSRCLDAPARLRLLRELVAHAAYVDASLAEAWSGGGTAANRAFWFRGFNAPLIVASRQVALLTMLPELEARRPMLDRAHRLIDEYLETFVTAEGHQAERDSAYHMGAFSYTLEAALLGRLNDVPFPPALAARLEPTVRVLVRIIQPNGHLPPLGNIRLEAGPQDYFALGAAVFDRPEYRYFGREPQTIRTALVLRHAAGPSRDGRRSPARRPALGSDALPSTGFFVMRSGGGVDGPGAGERESLYLLFDLAPSYGHTHYDALNVIIAGYGSRPPFNLLDDSGVGRNWHVNPLTPYYFSARAHNVVVIDDRPPPSWEGDPRPVLRKWASTSFLDLASGSHGKRYQGNDVTRTVLFVKGEYWLLRDEIHGAGRHRIEQVFNFAPVVRAGEGGARVRTLDVHVERGTKRAWPEYAGPRLMLVPVRPDAVTAAVVPGWKSHPVYAGSLPPPTSFGDVASPTLVYALTADTSTVQVLETVLFPLREGERRSVTATPLEVRSSTGQPVRAAGFTVSVGPSNVHSPGGSVDYFVTGNGGETLTAGAALAFRGRQAVVRTARGGAPFLLCMIDGLELRFDTATIRSLEPADTCLHRAEGGRFSVESTRPVTVAIPRGADTLEVSVPPGRTDARLAP